MVRSPRWSLLHYVPVEEITSVSQYELAPEVAAVLDAHASVFVWLGALCCPRAKDDARNIAETYLAHGTYCNIILDSSSYSPFFYFSF